jgi:NitT/TauT family transport system substrate-binding protein
MMGVGVTRRDWMLFGAAACLPAAARSTPLRAETPLKLALDGRIEGPSAPFLLALEQGYFSSERLDVSVEASTGGLEPLTRVAAGGADFALGDINAFIRYRDQNPAAPVRAIFVVNNRPGYALISRKSRGVVEPQDLEGKRLGAPVAEHASAQWPILAKLNQVDQTKVAIINVGLPVREPMLAAGEVDAITGSTYGSPVNLREKGIPANDLTVLLMASYGLQLYGNTLLANTRTLADKPEAVTGFLRALTRGIKDTIRDPGAALAPVMRRGTALTREIELERLNIAIRDCFVTPEVQANGFGHIDRGRFETALEQIGLGYAFKTKPKPDDIIDLSFLPAEAERKFD